MKILVWDSGYLFFGVAKAYAEENNKVYYYTPRPSNSPTPHIKIGEGYEDIGLERVDDPFAYIDKVDLIVFCDVNDGHMVDYFRSKNYKVIGSGYEAEDLELDRTYFREVLEKLKLPVANYEVITGVDELEEYLKTHKDKWLKIPFFRGLKETQHTAGWDNETKKYFYDICKECGVFRDEIEFLAEDPIDGAEIGTDSWFSANGTFSKYVLFGTEIKNEMYACRVVEHSKLPKGLLEIDEKIAPIYKKGGLIGPVSTEVRVNSEGKFFYTDACMRFGMPPFDLTCKLFGNITEMSKQAVNGEDIEPDINFLYGVSIFMTSEEAKKDYLKVEFPKNLSEQVFLRAPVIVDGIHYTTPVEENNLVCTVIGLGDTLDEAIEEAKEIASKVEAKGIGYRESVFDDLKETLKKAKEEGVSFDD